jgi:hypothetical protein
VVGEFVQVVEVRFDRKGSTLPAIVQRHEVRGELIEVCFDPRSFAWADAEPARLPDDHRPAIPLSSGTKAPAELANEPN